ncbi:hypothetical protein Nepgr_023962 [Nepenthes gracilis]|uniref:Uncharacterized protein n=1 Tax=Nepenthes gracilis TaxID=150966 RepID=A0AAD3T3R6_NEPGR|nr:hypothetical protein Nepgr_023962 [Nepenthes gracilis]
MTIAAGIFQYSEDTGGGCIPGGCRHPQIKEQKPEAPKWHCQSCFVEGPQGPDWSKKNVAGGEDKVRGVKEGGDRLGETKGGGQGRIQISQGRGIALVRVTLSELTAHWCMTLSAEDGADGLEAGALCKMLCHATGI